MTREVYFEDKPCLFCEFCREPTTMTLIKGTEKTELDEHPLYDAFQMSAKYVCDECGTQYNWSKMYVCGEDVGSVRMDMSGDDLIEKLKSVQSRFKELNNAMCVSFNMGPTDIMESNMDKIKDLRDELVTIKTELVGLRYSCEECDRCVEDKTTHKPVCELYGHLCENGVCRDFVGGAQDLDNTASGIIMDMMTKENE